MIYLPFPWHLSGGDFNQPDPSKHTLYILERIVFQSITAHTFGQNSSPKFCDGDIHAGTEGSGMRYNCSYPGVQRWELWMGPDPATVIRHKSALILVVIVAALCMAAGCRER